jgi:hypothetical protein
MHGETVKFGTYNSLYCTEYDLYKHFAVLRLTDEEGKRHYIEVTIKNVLYSASVSIAVGCDVPPPLRSVYMYSCSICSVHVFDKVAVNVKLTSCENRVKTREGNANRIPLLEQGM